MLDTIECLFRNCIYSLIIDLIRCTDLNFDFIVIKIVRFQKFYSELINHIEGLQGYIVNLVTPIIIYIYFLE